MGFQMALTRLVWCEAGHECRAHGATRDARDDVVPCECQSCVCVCHAVAVLSRRSQVRRRNVKGVILSYLHTCVT